MQRALKFAEDLGNSTFKASTGWLASFLKRNTIASGTMSGERGDVDREVVDDWKKKIPVICEGYNPKDIFNMDKTGLFFRVTTRKSYHMKGSAQTVHRQCALPFYVLVPILQSEAKEVELKVRLVSDNLLTRDQKTKYKRIHGRLFELREKYEDDETYTTSYFLREVSHVLGTGPVPATAEDHWEDDE